MGLDVFVRLSGQRGAHNADRCLHSRASVSRIKLRLRHLHYDEHGVLRYPRQHDQAPESALADYLAHARALLDSLPCDVLLEGSADLSADFEHLRWFDLPSVCLEPAATSP